MFSRPVASFEFHCYDYGQHICSVKNYNPHEEGKYVLHHVPRDVHVLNLLGLATAVLDDYLLTAVAPSITGLALIDSAAVKVMQVSKNVSITSFYVVNSGLSEVHFEENWHVDTLSIVGSSLSHVPPTVAKLKSLRHLKIRQSPIRQVHLETFSELPKLLVVDLQYNKIASIIPKNSSECSQSLSELWLGGNKLIRVNLEVFAMFCLLQVIDLSSNAMEVIMGRFTNSHVGSIRLSQNHLQTLDLCPWNHLPDVYSITFQSNQLTQIPQCLEKLTNVSSINFANNNLSSVSMASFSMLGNLNRLIFSDNQITSFTNAETAPPLLAEIYVEKNDAKNFCNNISCAGVYNEIANIFNCLNKE